MISNLFNKNLLKVLSFFLISPGSRYNRKEIKEKTEMNNIPLDNTLQKLKSLNLINENKNIYSLNFNIEKNKEIFDILSNEYKYFNVSYKIFNILVETSEKLSKIKGIESVFLFGSYAKLIHTESSDIDIAIIAEKKIKNKQKLEKNIKKEISRISQKSKKEIQLHFLTQEDIKKYKSDAFIKDVLRNSKQIL